MRENSELLKDTMDRSFGTRSPSLPQNCSSTTARCIIPMQDWLGLDNAARINKPSTVGQNWRWRLKKTQLTKKLQKEICQMTTRYGRKNWA